MATQNLPHAAQPIAHINPALKGYTLHKPHPLSGHLAADPELLAATGKEEVGKVKNLLQAVSRLASDPEIKGLSGLQRGVDVRDGLRGVW
jgi:hypothetical protein